MRMKKWWASLAIAAGIFSAVTGAQAQAFPEKPVTLVIPFAAGGPTDVVARMIAIPMGKSLGQPVIVENTLGAGGTIATNRVARAPNNGYTVLLHHMGMSTAPALYRKLPYDPLNDFEYIGQVLDVPMTLLARKDFPANNLQELLAYVRTHKEKVSLANAGLGAVSHLCGMLFQQALGVDLTTVPFSGTAPAMNALLGGQVDLLCDQTTQTTQHIKAGTVRMYGVTTKQRIKALPDALTLNESGLKDFEVIVWHGVYAPKGTPAAVIDKVGSAIRASLKDPAFTARMADLGAEIVPESKQSPEGLRTWLQSEIGKWGPVIRSAGVYAD